MARWVLIRKHTIRESLLVERALLQSSGLLVETPHLEFYTLHPYLAESADLGYCLYVLDQDVDDARAILKLRDDSQTSYPCPVTGGKSRRLKNVPATLASTLLLLMTGTTAAYPVRRRMRVCQTSGERFMPAYPEPFTPDELGYEILTFGQAFKRFLAWTRSIGYDTSNSNQESDEP